MGREFLHVSALSLLAKIKFILRIGVVKSYLKDYHKFSCCRHSKIIDDIKNVHQTVFK